MLVCRICVVYGVDRRLMSLCDGLLMVCELHCISYVRCVVLTCGSLLLLCVRSCLCGVV